MSISNSGLIAGCIIFITLCHNANASTAHPVSNQAEQDRAREASLTPQQQQYQPSQINSAEEKIIFPEENNCKFINEINVESENNELTQRLLKKIIFQAKSKCLGIEGIRLLARTMQNELIAKGILPRSLMFPLSPWIMAYYG